MWARGWQQKEKKIGKCADKSHKFSNSDKYIGKFLYLFQFSRSMGKYWHTNMSRLNRINHDIDWNSIFCSSKPTTTQISISVARTHTNSKIIHMFHLVPFIFVIVVELLVLFSSLKMPHKTNDDKRFEWDSLPNVIGYTKKNAIRICSFNRIFRMPANHNQLGKKT